MQKTFSIAALLTITAAIAIVASLVLASREHQQPETAINVTLMPNRITSVSPVEPRSDSYAGIVNDAFAEFFADAITLQIGDSVRDVAVESWQRFESDRSLTIEARWTEVITGKVISRTLKLEEEADGVYAGKIPGITDSDEVQVIRIEFGKGNPVSDAE